MNIPSQHKHFERLSSLKLNHWLLNGCSKQQNLYRDLDTVNSYVMTSIHIYFVLTLSLFSVVSNALHYYYKRSKV